MWIEVLLTALTLYALWHVVLRKPANYPPGPWGIPFIGYIPIFTKKKNEDMLRDLNKKHGDIVSWRIGKYLMVFLFDYDLVKEAFSSKNFLDKPNVKLTSFLQDEPKRGLIATYGEYWHNNRRFSLRHLRDLGMGKSSMVSVVQDEALLLVKELKKNAGVPLSVAQFAAITVVNVIWQMVASKRYDMNDEEIKKFQNDFSTYLINLQRIAFVDYFPWLRTILPMKLLNKFTHENLREDLRENLLKFINGFVTEHQKTLDPNDPRDYIDAYLIEMENRKDDPKSTMEVEDLVICISDLFGAGSETTTVSLTWWSLYMAKYPKVQEKLQKELDQALPLGTLVTLDHKPSLPYTEAVVHELLRHSSLAPLGGFHMPSSDVQFGGYLIPKGAFIVSASFSIHYNSKYFESPNEFRPERFLDSDGKFVAPKEGFVPFGIGRRQCLGEALARMELFVVGATLLQNLNFSAPPGIEIDLTPLEGNPFMHRPQLNQNIVVTARS